MVGRSVLSWIFRCLLPIILALGSVPPAVAAERHDVSRQELIDVGGYTLNSVFLPAGPQGRMPPVVFIHGASANLFDPMLSYRKALEGQADLLFVDRPGHGRSSRGGPQNAFPDGQADAIAVLMRKRGIHKAIIVSHSFGGAVAASFALRHPDMVIGLLFMSPAVYPWPGGVAWYYDAASTPVAGRLFSAIVVPTAGLAMINAATKSVFAPNKRPPGYIADTKALLAIRPQAFRNNAIDVKNLHAWTERASLQYSKIRAPAIIITGDTDSIVSPTIHSAHLARDLRHSRLITIHNLGHKSDYVARALAVAAIETLAGRKRNLSRLAHELEQAIADDGK